MSKNRDFKLGDDGEKRVIEIFDDFGFSCNKNNTKNLIDYDLLVQDTAKKIKDFTLEVKNDWYAKKSGNIAIEYFNSNKNTDSGIAATKSDLWVHIVEDVYLVKTKVLKKYVDTYVPHRHLLNVGDGNAHIYLYKIEEIIEDIFVNISRLSKLKGRKLIKELLE